MIYFTRNFGVLRTSTQFPSVIIHSKLRNFQRRRDFTNSIVQKEITKVKKTLRELFITALQIKIQDNLFHCSFHHLNFELKAKLLSIRERLY